MPPHDDRDVIPPGVTRTLARDRAARISSLVYDLSLDVPPAAAEPVRGRLTATFDLADARRALDIDFAGSANRLESLSVNGCSSAVALRSGHIRLPAEHLVDGRNVVTVAFTAGDEALNRHDDYLYSLFVPARACRTFPCFDQPSLRARWRLGLTLPAGWEGLSNGVETSRHTARGRLTLTFAETAPLPTYLFAIVAGRFAVESAERNGRTFRVLHRHADATRLARSLDRIIDLHAAAVSWLEACTAVPYPFEKFDFVLIPSFQFGGMEHPGAVYYDADRLLLDETATLQQTLARATLIAHETAHIWFGDLVTLEWFDDVWMKEAFASFFADRIVELELEDADRELRFLLQHYPAAYEVDRTAGANPIRQPLDNLDQAGTLYGAIIYHKAPIVMRQLERLVGPDEFRAAVRDFLDCNRFGHASWPDFVTCLDRRSTVDIRSWSRIWIDQPGRPLVVTDLDVRDGVIARLAFRQSDCDGLGRVWPQPLSAAVGWHDRTLSIDQDLRAGEVVVAAATGLPAPAWVLAVGGGWGYGVFDLGIGTRARLLADLAAIADPTTRGAAVVALWEEMLDGRVAPAALLQAIVASAPRETNDLILQHLLDRIVTLFWRFTPDQARPGLAAQLEPMLRRGVERTASSGGRAAWFHALRTVALTDDTLDWLEAVWRRTQAIPDLSLAERDEIDLAADLAVRRGRDDAAMLDEQLARTESPEGRARLAFLRPALSSNPEVRRIFFETLGRPSSRAPDAWIVDALRYLHHPLRRVASRALVVPGLQRLPGIQRNGDIFLTKRYADATLGGYGDPGTAADVRAFLGRLPEDYPPNLAQLVRASADMLFRAAAARSTALRP